MYPPCEVVGHFVLPIFRSLIAKELIEKYNFTQVEAAEKLGTTQAAISQYIHSKRGMEGITHFKKVLPTIQAAASGVAKDIATREMNADEVVLNFCKLCASLQKERKIQSLTASIKHMAPTTIFKSKS